MPAIESGIYLPYTESDYISAAVAPKKHPIPDEVKKEFEIVSDGRESGIVFDGKAQSGMLYETAGRGKWLIIPPEKKLVVKQETYVVNGAGVVFDARTMGVMYPKQKKIGGHDACEAITEELGDRLYTDGLLYKRFGKIVNKSGVQVRSELDMNFIKARYYNPEGIQTEDVCSAADSVIVGPDGQIPIVDYASESSMDANNSRYKTKKNHQLFMQSIGLETILMAANHTEERPQIVPFTGEYTTVYRPARRGRRGEVLHLLHFTNKSTEVEARRQRAGRVTVVPTDRHFSIPELTRPITQPARVAA